jgi:hypothetical protein
MKKVIYWFAFILSFEILLISVFELAGGAYNVILPPSKGIVIAFAIVTVLICFYSGLNLMRLYKPNK